MGQVMSTNPYKAFIPFVVNPESHYFAPENEDVHKATDPTAGDWRRVGLCEPIKGEGLQVELDGHAHCIMAVQFNERILPGKVRDEQLVKEVARMERLEGRKISKKEYAQLREQVEFDLLPKAFIRRSVVPIIFTRMNSTTDLMLVCTSSTKRADDCVAIMTGAYPDLKASALSVIDPVSSRLKCLAIDGFLFNEDTEQETGFFSSDSIALKGSEKKVIRIKDKPIEDGDVQDLIRLEEYTVVEMGVAWHNKDDAADGDDPSLTFVVNEHLTFKRITTPGVKATMLKEDFFAYTVMCQRLYRKMLMKFVNAFGGMPAVSIGASKNATADEDDDL
jgi:recombination associated protein RdgC